MGVVNGPYKLTYTKMNQGKMLQSNDTDTDTDTDFKLIKGVH